MYYTPDLRILFATSFSDSCFRTSRAIAQLTDTCRVSLTIKHVVKPGAATTGVRHELDSFMAEADNYDSCRRVLTESDDVIESIAEMCERDPYDLIVAPASDRLGVHSLFTRSFRARLMKRCRTPLWTAGACLDTADFRSSIRTIACVMDFDSNSSTYVPLVAAFAARFGAKLRIVSVLPEITEAALAQSIDSNTPLMPEVATERIQMAFKGRKCPEVDVVMGEAARELPRVLRRCGADLVFLGPGQVTNGSWWPRAVSRLDRLPCPVICVDGASAAFNRWTFQGKPMLEEAPVLVSSNSREDVAIFEDEMEKSSWATF